MITLNLYGQLASLFGDSISLDARTPREAVTALAFQCGEYKEIVRSNDWHIFVGDKNNDITEAELDLKLGTTKEVHLIPRIEGASGAFNFVVGAILFTVGAVLTFGSGGALTPVTASLMAAGVGMMVGGIVQMMTKIPGTDSTSRELKDDQASFLFSGATNTSTQGVGLPRGYGRMLVGSIVVSASLSSENTSSYQVPPAKLKDKVALWANHHKG